MIMFVFSFKLELLSKQVWRFIRRIPWVWNVEEFQNNSSLTFHFTLEVLYIMLSWMLRFKAWKVFIYVSVFISEERRWDLSWILMGLICLKSSFLHIAMHRIGFQTLFVRMFIFRWIFTLPMLFLTLIRHGTNDAMNSISVGVDSNVHSSLCILQKSHQLPFTQKTLKIVWWVKKKENNFSVILLSSKLWYEIKSKLFEENGKPRKMRKLLWNNVSLKGFSFVSKFNRLHRFYLRSRFSS